MIPEAALIRTPLDDAYLSGPVIVAIILTAVVITILAALRPKE